MNIRHLPYHQERADRRPSAGWTAYRPARGRTSTPHLLTLPATDDVTALSDGIDANIRHRLLATGHHALQAIGHEYHEGTVILRGRVSIT